MHEWAMVYRTENIRHSYLPLCYDPSDIAKIVDGMPLKCTHYDAYRFFSDEARTKNANPDFSQVFS